MTWFLPGVCEVSVSEDSCLELLPDAVFEGSVSGDPRLELPPDTCDGYVSGDSCLMEPSPEQQIMWMNKTVQAKNSPPHLHRYKFSEITEIVMLFQNL